MKRLAAFILLVCHLNASMFLPEAPEQDVYDKNGVQLDDINSVAEYVAVELGYDHTADDEDDDSGKSFHVSKIETGYFQPQFCEVAVPKAELKNNTDFPEYSVPHFEEYHPDTVTPPPDLHLIS